MQATTKPAYVLTWFDPVKNEPGVLPLNDMSIALAYKDRKLETGMTGIELYSEWNKGPIREIKITALPVKT